MTRAAGSSAPPRSPATSRLAKTTEAQLKAKSAQLEEFAHALDLAPAMVRTFDGEILFWGRGLQNLYGWSAEEAIGRISHELLGDAVSGPACLKSRPS